MSLNRPVHFEIHSNDPDRTNRFFSDVFGWSITPWRGGPTEYWLAGTGKQPGGIDGGVMRSRDGQPRIVNTIRVEDVDRMAERVVKAGGTIVVPKMTIPGVGYLMYATDPTGVLFGFMHDDVAAA